MIINIDNMEYPKLGDTDCIHPPDREVVNTVYKDTIEESYIEVICSLCGKVLKTFK